MKGCGVKVAKAASQATSSDRALLPTSSQAGRMLGHAHALHTLCKESFLWLLVRTSKPATHLLFAQPLFRPPPPPLVVQRLAEPRPPPQPLATTSGGQSGTQPNWRCPGRAFQVGLYLYQIHASPPHETHKPHASQELHTAYKHKHKALKTVQQCAAGGAEPILFPHLLPPPRTS